jgi:hypothetical protein
MPEPRGHPGAAMLIVLFTVTPVFCGAAFWMWDIAMTEGGSGRRMPGGQKAAGFLIIFVVLVSGLVFAWLVGSGRILPRRAWVPTHQVPAGGMKAWGQQDISGEGIDLTEHLLLRLDRVRGVRAKVTGSNGATGWVEARLLVSMSTLCAEPPAAGVGEGGS